MQFPRCDLHGTKVVFELPPGCCLAVHDVAARLKMIRDKSYTDLSAGNDSHPASVADAVYSTCNNCVARLSANSHIQYLRERAGVVDA